jgi:hypothetical protein
MKRSEKVRLLTDVLKDETYLAFRGELYGALAGDLRRQRQLRSIRKWFAVAACVPVLFAAYLFLNRHAPDGSPHTSDLAVVRTMPFNPGSIVVTANAHGQPAFLPTELVVSTKAGELQVIRSPKGVTETLTDEQLLDLFKGQPVALVQVGPNERRLILPSDEPK